MNATDSGTDATFSRPTSSSLQGKRGVPLKTMVQDEVGEDFAKFARERGYGSGSDALYELILVTLYGDDFLTDIHRKRISSLFQNRTRTVPSAKQEEGAT